MSSILHGIAAVSMLFQPSAAPDAPTPEVVQNAQPETPEAVATVEEKQGFVYRRFPSRERLYTYDDDPVGQSVCINGCDTRWPPLLAPANAKPIGEWTPIVRREGRLQWAYKGKPVYTRFHDLPDAPEGDGIEGKWRIVPPVSRSIPPAR